MDVRKDISWRLAIIYVLVAIVASIILVKILYLQFVNNEIYEEQVKQLQFKYEKTNPDRGDICADDGRILATSTSYYEIRMDLGSPSMLDTTFAKNIDALSDSLANLFGDKTKQEYLTAFNDAKARKSMYFLVRKNVNYAQLKKLKTFPIFRLGQYKGGLIVIETKKRIRPFGMLAARTVGYIKNGIAVGLEGSFDNELTGNDNIVLMRKVGHTWVPMSEQDTYQSQSGKDIITTIDINFQDFAHQTLLNQLVNFDADHGTVILMEVKSGEIKAIVNLKRNKNNEFEEAYNYAIGERTEPGSTFKLPSLMVALEDNYVDLDDSVNTGNGLIKYHDFLIRDSRIGGYGKLTVKQAFEHSSNVGISQIIYKAYKDKPEKFVKRLYSMNLNEPLGIEIAGESAPLIKFPNSSGWSGISLPQMSIGYEILLTPLQTLNFYNAVANNGVMVKPKLVKAIRQHGKIIEVEKTEILNPSICSKETIEKAHKMLEGVVEHGTAYNIKSANFKIAGKTGTAQIAHGSLGYRDTANRITHQASFAGYFPAGNPKYSCIVLIKTKSHRLYYGSTVAAPVFRKIADKVYATSTEMQKDISYGKSQSYPTNGVPYSKDGNRTDLDYVFNQFRIPVKGRNQVRSAWVVTKQHKKFVEYQNRLVKRKQVPKVVGMALKDALYILESLGLKVNVDGRGIIKKQSLKPGTSVKQNQKITLYLS
jgi:cell division protein FtsI (penicillin-binding protein 3)